MSSMPQPMVRIDRLGMMAPRGNPAWADAVSRAIADSLLNAGWSVNGRQLVKGSLRFDPGMRAHELTQGVLSPQRWLAACQVAEIGEIEIQLPASPTGAWLSAPLPQPAEESAAVASSSNRRKRGWLLAAGAVIALVAFGGLTFQVGIVKIADACNPCANSKPIESPPPGVSWADGRSEVPGGWVNINYALEGHDWETIDKPTNAKGRGDQAGWWLREMLDTTKATYGVRVMVVSPAVSSLALERKYAAGQEGFLSSATGKPVKHRMLRVDGRRGYAWQYVTPEGAWMRDIFVFGPERTYRFMCVAGRATVSEQRHVDRRCTRLLKSTRFTRDA